MMMNLGRIPKKSQHANLLTSNSQEEKSVHASIFHSFLFPKSSQRWQQKETLFVINPHLEKAFRDRKAVLKEEIQQAFVGTRPPPLIEELFFLGFSKREDVELICEEGVNVDEKQASILGNSKFGVHLYRYADICLDYLDRQDQTVFLLVCKVVTGRVKHVVPNRGEPTQLEPTPTHHSHVPATKPSPTDSLVEANYRAQVFVYEYDEECCPAPKPSHILPYAVVEMKYRPGVSTELRDNSYTRRLFKLPPPHSRLQKPSNATNCDMPMSDSSDCSPKHIPADCLTGSCEMDGVSKKQSPPDQNNNDPNHIQINRNLLANNFTSIQSQTEKDKTMTEMQRRDPRLTSGKQKPRNSSLQKQPSSEANHTSFVMHPNAWTSVFTSVKPAYFPVKEIPSPLKAKTVKVSPRKPAFQFNENVSRSENSSPKKSLLDYTVEDVVKKTMKRINMDKPEVESGEYLAMVWKYSMRRLDEIDSRSERDLVKKKVMLVMEREYRRLKSQNGDKFSVFKDQMNSLDSSKTSSEKLISLPASGKPVGILKDTKRYKNDVVGMIFDQMDRSYHSDSSNSVVKNGLDKEPNVKDAKIKKSSSVDGTAPAQDSTTESENTKKEKSTKSHNLLERKIQEFSKLFTSRCGGKMVGTDKLTGDRHKIPSVDSPSLMTDSDTENFKNRKQHITKLLLQKNESSKKINDTTDEENLDSKVKEGNKRYSPYGNTRKRQKSGDMNGKDSGTKNNSDSPLKLQPLTSVTDSSSGDPMTKYAHHLIDCDKSNCDKHDPLLDPQNKDWSGESSDILSDAFLQEVLIDAEKLWSHDEIEHFAAVEEVEADSKNQNESMVTNDKDASSKSSITETSGKETKVICETPRNDAKVKCVTPRKEEKKDIKLKQSETKPSIKEKTKKDVVVNMNMKHTNEAVSSLRLSKKTESKNLWDSISNIITPSSPSAKPPLLSSQEESGSPNSKKIKSQQSLKMSKPSKTVDPPAKKEQKVLTEHNKAENKTVIVKQEKSELPHLEEDTTRQNCDPKMTDQDKIEESVEESEVEERESVLGACPCHEETESGLAASVEEDDWSATVMSTYTFPPLPMDVSRVCLLEKAKFTALDLKVCTLYEQYCKAHKEMKQLYNSKVKTKDDPVTQKYVRKKLQKQCETVAKLHVEIERLVLHFESQVYGLNSEDRKYYLSTWQRNKLVSIKIQLESLQEAVTYLGEDDKKRDKVSKLVDQHAKVLNEVLIPRLPRDSPGNSRRQLQYLFTTEWASKPSRAVFMQRKLLALQRRYFEEEWKDKYD